jgi:L-alanine-DL-glutamate epimerase-like enolase superfamily enzyme
MKIVAIHEKTVSLASPMRNAGIGFGDMTASAVAIITDVRRHGRPVVGLAFDSVGRFSHGGLLRERFIPRLLAADPEDCLDETRAGFDPFKTWAILMRDEKPGGHGERPGAVGLLDAAVWDIVAKLEDKPLWRVLAERFGTVRDEARVSVYASGGHYRATDDIGRLREDIERCVALGYRQAKIKFGGLPLSGDMKRIEVALEVLGGRGKALAVDCNAAFQPKDARNIVASLADYQLAWIEEPVEPLDFEAHKELVGDCRCPIATGENIFSAADTLNLVRYAGLRPSTDILQMDVSLSYGIVEYLRILDVAAAHGWSRRRFMPHAGNLLAFHVVAGLGLGGHETAPLGPFPLGLPVEDGCVRAPDIAGVGFERNPNFQAVFADLLPWGQG